MNQQQLQIARAALWRQTPAPSDAPSTPGRLITFDDAASWLDEVGLALFLPRHAQLPAPAPSLVEASMGEPALTPPPAAIVPAMDLASRLIAEGRAIPLNLLGAFSEQPDFLVTPEVLPWVVAVRGDRQWKTAPAGRTAPIVTRAWETLDREGDRTAVEIRAALGRELTEAAVLRALVELWTTLRAFPIYAAGEPTRWTLFKSRYASQLTAAANTAQTTALSALISLYLRSAIAATAEETEVFLSPLTARSRIREVVHGMMATRQFGTTTVSSQTLLFVEGSLPEFVPIPEAEPAAPAPARPRPPFRKEPQREPRKAPRPWQKREDRPGPRREFRPAAQNPASAPDSEPRPEPRSAPPRREFSPNRGPKPPARFSGPKKFAARRDAAPGRPRRDQRGPSKPWQKRDSGEFRPHREDGREKRPPRKYSEGRREGSFRPSRTGPPREPRPEQERHPESRRELRPEFRSGSRPPFKTRRPESGDRPFRKPRTDGEQRPRSEFRPEFRSGPRPQRPRFPKPEGREDRPRFEKRFESRPPRKYPAGPRGEGSFRPARPGPPRSGSKFPGKPRFSGPPKPGDRRFSGTGKPRPGGDSPRPFRGKPSGPQSRANRGPGKPFKPFRKSGPASPPRGPQKNRKPRKEENSE